jgi:hypothetical protein
MLRSTVRAGALLLALSLFAAAPGVARADAEADVRAAFAALQAALKAGDAEKIWPLLDKDSQAAAERVAKGWKGRYNDARPRDRLKLEKMFGLTAKEMAGLTGKLYVKSKRYLGVHDEIAPSKVTKVAVAGDKATVFYTEPDGDKVKLELVKQGGQWKVSLKAE